MRFKFCTRTNSFCIYFLKMERTVNQCLEIAAVVFLFPPCLVLMNIAIAGYVILSKFYSLIALYAIWYFVSRNYDSRGGHRVQWIRDLRCWKYYSNYFPIKLIKTADLSPCKNYLCGFHPHGFYSGIAMNFMTEGTGFSLKFPNLRAWAIAHCDLFKIPLQRELTIAFGGRNVSRESIKWLLTKEGVGNMVVLIPGGLEEMSYAEKKKYKLKLISRKGFIRLAIETGASLVPIFSFGENDTYHVHQATTWLGRKLLLFKERTKKPNFIFHGPLKCLPMLPFRNPINTVVGSPIDVQQNADPTDEEICILQNMYIEKLRQLYDNYKDRFGHENVELEIV